MATEQNKERLPTNTQIDRISAVYSLRGRVRRAGTPNGLIVGWTLDGRPAVASSLESLTASAQKSYQAYPKELGFPTCEYSTLEPVKYSYVGRAMDYKDQPGKFAEDAVSIGIEHADGRKEGIAVKELDILRAIIEAKQQWQDATEGSLLTETHEADQYYTLLLPKGGDNEAYALLLTPDQTGGNQIKFKTLVREIIARFLALDEQQPPHMRKGYMEDAARISAKYKPNEPNGFVKFLGDMGLVAIEKDDQVERPKVPFYVQTIKFLKSAGLVDADTSELSILEDPLPSYNIDNLKIEQFFELAEEMYRTGWRKIKA